jgi:hypothetical protein
MKLLKQFTIFFVLVLAVVCFLWWLPGPNIEISAGHEKSTNSYWWWLALGLLVVVGTAFEYFTSEFADQILRRLSRKQKVIIGTVLACVAIVGAFHGVYAYYH